MPGFLTLTTALGLRRRGVDGTGLGRRRGDFAVSFS